jgi:predicted metal-binding protein
MLSVYYNIDKLRRKQALTYLFGSLLENDSAKSFVSPERQGILLERMKQAWTSVGSSVRSEVVGRFSTTAITSKLA